MTLNAENLYDKKELTFLFFWGHNEQSPVTKACLSQWYDCTFQVDGTTFHSAEQYMMAQKAKLFGDFDSYSKILLASSPKECKSLGRKVQGFDADQWDKICVSIVIEGNIAKFSQNKELKQFLLSTDDKILVEASPYDSIWGIGMTHDNPCATVPFKWKGKNLLGFALMEVRMRLKEMERPKQ